MQKERRSNSILLDFKHRVSYLPCDQQDMIRMMPLPCHMFDWMTCVAMACKAVATLLNDDELH